MFLLLPPIFIDLLIFKSKFEFEIKLPQNYPDSVAEVQCKTKMFHPNIGYDGSVCFNLFNEYDDEWNSSVRLVDYVHGLLWLLYEPNLDSRLNGAVPNDQQEFARLVREAIIGGQVITNDGEEHFPSALIVKADTDVQPVVNEEIVINETVVIEPIVIDQTITTTITTNQLPVQINRVNENVRQNVMQLRNLFEAIATPPQPIPIIRRNVVVHLPVIQIIEQPQIEQPQIIQTQTIETTQTIELPTQIEQPQIIQTQTIETTQTIESPTQIEQPQIEQPQIIETQTIETTQTIESPTQIEQSQIETTQTIPIVTPIITQRSPQPLRLSRPSISTSRAPAKRWASINVPVRFVNCVRVY